MQCLGHRSRGADASRRAFNCVVVRSIIQRFRFTDVSTSTSRSRLLAWRVHTYRNPAASPTRADGNRACPARAHTRSRQKASRSTAFSSTRTARAKAAPARTSPVRVCPIMHPNDGPILLALANNSTWSIGRDPPPVHPSSRVVLRRRSVNFLVTSMHDEALSMAPVETRERLGATLRALHRARE